MDRRPPAISSTLIGFLPWIVYWTVRPPGGAVAAVGAGLATAVGVALWRLPRGGPKTMEIATLGFFAAASLSLAVGLDLLRTYGALAAAGALAAIAWGSLAAGRPFTLDYARDQVAPEVWTTPLFRRTNIILTTAWGAVFTANALLASVVLVRPAARLWLEVVVPNLLVAAGVTASIVVPRRYPRRWAAREIARQEPYRWTPPPFTGRAGAAGDHHDVIVVGAGIGGLTAAALLARRGLSVLVLEQHYLAGGFCTSWSRLVRRGQERLRYVFDAGVHDVSGLGPRGPVRHLLETLAVADRLQWRRVRHEYLLSDLRLAVPEDACAFVARLVDLFPAEATGVRAFFAEMEAVYRELYANVHATGGIPGPPTTVDAMLAYPAAHPHVFRWMQVPFDTMLRTYFADPRLRALMSILSGYLSGDRRDLTVGAMAPIFGYYFDGGHYPVGGSQALSDALVSAIQEGGGTVRLRTAVRRILVERGRATGVETASGTIHRAGAIVSNADLARTFGDLVGLDGLPADFAGQVAALRPSTSAFIVFLGLDTVPDLAPITLLAGQGERVGIAIPSKVDPSLAPPGHSSVSLVTLVPPDPQAWDRRAPGYAARKRMAGDRIIAVAERAIPGLRQHIVYRQDGSPATFARYAWTTGGAIYGPALGQWRPPVKTPIEGLVLAGAGVFPGAGVEATVISGTRAADALCPVAVTAERAPTPVAA